MWNVRILSDGSSAIAIASNMMLFMKRRMLCTGSDVSVKDSNHIPIACVAGHMCVANFSIMFRPSVSNIGHWCITPNTAPHCGVPRSDVENYICLLLPPIAITLRVRPVYLHVCHCRCHPFQFPHCEMPPLVQPEHMVSIAGRPLEVRDPWLLKMIRPKGGVGVLPRTIARCGAVGQCVCV